MFALLFATGAETGAGGGGGGGVLELISTSLSSPYKLLKLALVHCCLAWPDTGYGDDDGGGGETTGLLLRLLAMIGLEMGGSFLAIESV